MGRIQSSVGLISGINIEETVEKLMALASRPRETLAARNATLVKEQTAVTELSALLAALEYTSDKLGGASLYSQQKATSSNEAALGATLSGDAAAGSYRFTPLRMVQGQQLLSSAFGSQSEALGAGEFSFRFGSHVEPAARLEWLAGGQGFSRGRIRITDRSGAAAEIDLSTAQTIDDVLEAINSNTSVHVTASVQGDSIRLVDNTGQTSANLRVEEAGGTTAASLGLAGINVAANTADGQDILQLAGALRLDLLNDGRGVSVSRALSDIEYTLRDGTTGQIDLSPILEGGSTVDDDATLGDVLARINAAAPGKLQAAIAPDGDRLLITDLTVGGGSFALESLYGSDVLADLGIDGAAAGGVITGRRLMGGLKTVLLTSLNGGRGTGSLGVLDITNRAGVLSQVNLSAAETLEDVVAAINAGAAGITARVSQARTGIELVDTTGAALSNLIVTASDGSTSDVKLGLTVNAAVTSVASGDMHLQVVAGATKLASLNGGAGVARGTFTIVDSAGPRITVSLADDDIQTVGDLVAEINRVSPDIRAELNDTGDGIRLRRVDPAGGTFEVVAASGTTAADLHLLGTSVATELQGETVHALDGTATVRIELEAGDTLADLQEKINAAGAGLTASTFSDGSSVPYRLSLVSQRTGTAGQLVIDTSIAGFSLQEITKAQDALLVLGDPAAGASALISSTSNTFRGVLGGVDLQVKEASATPVTITVAESDSNLVATVQTMVDNYNKVRTRLSALTKYDAATDTSSVLTGDATALRLDTELGYLVSGRFWGSSSVTSLEQIGIHLTSDGTLDFDTEEFRDAMAADPAAVRGLLSDEETGVSARFHELIEQLAGEKSSLLSGRLNVLTDKIALNEERLTSMDERLKKQQERLLMQFYRLELTIGKMQTSMNALSALAPIAPLTSTKRS